MRDTIDLTTFFRAPLLATAISILSPLACAQAVKTNPREGAPPPPVTYRGLVPGASTVEDARERLGRPVHEAAWYDWKMLYPAEEPAGVPGEHVDAIHLQGDTPAPGRRIGTIESFTVPDGLESLEDIEERLGPPEFHLTYPGGQHLLDYSAKGIRFTLDPEGETIGVAYFPHGRARVHDGLRRRLDLSWLPQGPRPMTPAPPGLRLAAGAAVVDITPEKETYDRDFRVLDPLKARCVVFESGGTSVAVVGADLFGMLKSEIDPIEERLREEGIDHLVLAMSHNHAAPDTIGIYGHYPERYVESIQERVARGVLEAAERLVPVERLLVSAGDLSLAGARVEGLFRNARNPGIVDPQVALLQAVGDDGEPIVTLVGFACHPEGLAKGPREVSADFPGVLCDRLEASTGAPAVFLNGALGGMVTGDTKARTPEEARIMGERLAREVERVLGFATASRSRDFSFRRKRLEVPVTNPRFIAFHALAPERRPWKEGRIVTELFYLRLGDAEIVTVPGELLPELSFEIIARMRGYPRMIVGLANDELGYIIPGQDFRANTYEESMSVGPAMGPLVKECALRLLEEARKE